MLARMKADVTIDQAQADVTSSLSGWQKTFHRPITTSGLI
jgi:hypothetical protein